MPTPTPDPVNESISSGIAANLGWADFATIMGSLIAILSFVYALVKGKKVSDSDNSEGAKDDDKETRRSIEAKVRDIKRLTEDLDDSYRELKKEIDSLEDSIDDLDKKTAKDIRRLEEKMDKIIDLILKLLSEQ